MTSQEFAACVHPRELPRFLLALLFALPLTLLLLAVIYITSGLALALILAGAFFVWFSFEVGYATLVGHWILVSDQNYPRLKTLLEDVKREIGVNARIDMIVFEQGAFNAMFSMLFARRAIFIFSELLEDNVSDDELRWIIGRFVGRIRAKRRMGVFDWMITAAQYMLVFNFFIFPYVRATAYTGDRAGLAAINGNISVAVSAMNKLMVGRQLGYSVNPEGIVTQYRRIKGSLFAFLGRLISPLPYMVARYVDLIGFSEQRFPAAYEEFAAMNPAFQIAGSTARLFRSGPAYSDQDRKSLAASVGWLLLGATIATSVGSVYLIAARGGMAPGLGALLGSYAPLNGASTLPSDPSAIGDTTSYDPSMAPPAEAPAAPAPIDFYGAFVVSDSQARYVAYGGNDSQDNVQQTALNDCNSVGASDCRVLFTVKNQCASLAYSYYTGETIYWSTGEGATEAEAAANAITYCSASRSGCQTAKTICGQPQDGTPTTP